MNESQMDSWGLVPLSFPAHPRVLTTPSKLRRTRELLDTATWGAAAKRRLMALAEAPPSFPRPLPVPAVPAANRQALAYARDSIIAFLLMDREEFREQALETFRMLADAFPHWPLLGPSRRATEGAALCSFDGCGVGDGAGVGGGAGATAVGGSARVFRGLHVPRPTPRKRRADPARARETG